MKNVKYIVSSIVCYIIFVVLQTKVFNSLSILNVFPNLYIIFVIYLSIFSDSKVLPSILIVILGLIFDVCYGKVIGLSALIGFSIINVTPEICHKSMFETRIGMMTYVFMATFIVEIFSGIIFLLLNKATFVFSGFALNVIICALYNFLLTLFIYPIFSESVKKKNTEFKLIRRY